jgi:hypothetical protein
MRKPGKFPPGWDEERVQRVLKHYESQSEAEAVAEDEAALEVVGRDRDECSEGARAGGA